MSKRKVAPVKSEPEGNAKAAKVHMKPGESEADTIARTMVAPFLRHGVVVSTVNTKMAGKMPGEPGFENYGFSIKMRAQEAADGNLALGTELLTAQALSLDTIFTEMARRSAQNMGDYIDASERYMRLALKAQANSRATIEALAKLHRPREQTVRHVHVNEGDGLLLPTNSTIMPGGRKMRNQSDNPMQPEPEQLAQAPRCQARTRSGQPCRSAAVKGNRRCRMHGGKGSGAPRGNSNAWKHGARSGETLAAIRYVREMTRQLGE